MGSKLVLGKNVVVLFVRRPCCIVLNVSFDIANNGKFRKQYMIVSARVEFNVYYRTPE